MYIASNRDIMLAGLTCTFSSRAETFQKWPFSVFLPLVRNATVLEMMLRQTHPVLDGGKVNCICFALKSIWETISASL